MTTIDWNWFFSALAQSSAAIVGIFGAFLTASIISNEREYRLKRSRLETLFKRAEVLRKRISNFRKVIEWCAAEQINLALKEIEASMFDPKTRLRKPPLATKKTAYKFYLKADFGRFVPEEKAVTEILAYLEELNRNHIVTLRHRNAEAIQVDESVVHRKQVLNSETSKVLEFFNSIDQSILDIKTIWSEIKENPESSTTVEWTLWLIAAMFLAGVVYPLALLPIPPQHIFLPYEHGLAASLWFPVDIWGGRSILLLIVTTIFGILWVVLFRKNRQFKYQKEDFEKLAKLITPEWYSDEYASYVLSGMRPKPPTNFRAV